MPFRSADDLQYFQFEQLSRPEITHGIFTRHGGVSPAPWATLNVGGTVGDRPGRVMENRRRLLAALGRTPESLYEVWQVHSARYVVAVEPRGDEPLAQADILLTREPAVTLLMRFADCVPLMLFDPGIPAIALAHAGWLGTLRRTAAAAVRAMVKEFGSQPSRLIACLGPSIGPDHYEIGEDVASAFRDQWGEAAQTFMHSQDGRVHLDLWAANRALLAGEGVVTIESAAICTACHLEDWYSHRAEAGRTGRFGAAIALRG